MQNNTQESWEEKLPKMICDLIWSVTDGGCKIKPDQMLSYQDEPVREYEDITTLIRSTLTKQAEEISEAVEGLYKAEIADENDVAYLTRNNYNLALDQALLAIKQVTNK